MSIFYTKFPFWATFSDSVDILLKQGWLSNTKFDSYKWHMSGCNWCVHLASILTDFKPGGLKLIKGYFCCCALLFVLWRQYKPSISYLLSPEFKRKCVLKYFDVNLIFMTHFHQFPTVKGVENRHVFTSIFFNFSLPKCFL